MTVAVKPVIDHGQELARPEGQTIDFVDTKEQFDAVKEAARVLTGDDKLRAEGKPDQAVGEVSKSPRTRSTRSSKL
jgi:hypothetical protein